MDPRGELVVASLLGLFDRFRALPQVVDLSGPDVAAYASEVPHPMFNVVAGARFGDDARKRTREVVESFGPRPFLWWVDPVPGSREVAATLLELGLQSVAALGMHRAIGSTTPHDLLSTTAGDPRFVDLVMGANLLPDFVREPLLEWSPALDPDAAHLLVLDGDRPVACGSGIASGRTWGLYNIATLAEARGKGHGRRVVEALLHEGARRGLGDAVLHASPLLQPLYGAAGFEPVVELTEYVRPG